MFVFKHHTPTKKTSSVRSQMYINSKQSAHPLERFLAHGKRAWMRLLILAQSCSLCTAYRLHSAAVCDRRRKSAFVSIIAHTTCQYKIKIHQQAKISAPQSPMALTNVCHFLTYGVNAAHIYVWKVRCQIARAPAHEDALTGQTTRNKSQRIDRSLDIVQQNCGCGICGAIV